MNAFLHSQSGLAVLGFAMVGALTALVLSGRVAPLIALIVIPIVAAALGGFLPGVGPMVVDGLAKIAPLVAMIAFAILFFSLMLDAGLFEPLVKVAVGFTRDDPVRVTLATAVLALVIAFSGEAVSTGLVLLAAFLPIYRRLRMDPAILGALVAYAIAVQNLSPWAGPTTRVAAALSVDPMAVYLSVLPAVGAGCLVVCMIAYYFGWREKRRLRDPAATIPEAVPGEAAAGLSRDTSTARPHLIWANLALTLSVLATLALDLMSPVALFPLGSCLALLINYRGIDAQRERIAAHAETITSFLLVFFAAGLFTGILNGTGMIEAMAATLVQALPPSVGSVIAPVTALLSLPLNYLIPNDAFYFGAVPVLAKTAEAFGVTAHQTAAASLMGVPVHVLSPILPHVYIFSSLLGVAPGRYLRLALPAGVLLAIAMIAVAMVTGGFPAFS